MSLIDLPASPTPAEIQWSFRQPTQVNRSEWTGRRKVTLLAGAARWAAKVSLPLILGETRVMPWRAFLARCQGQAHWFKLVAVENVQINPGVVRIYGAGQSGYSLDTFGWGAVGIKLLAGQFVTIGDQLLQLVADVVSDGADFGHATLQFRSFIRVSPADRLIIEVQRPYALMSMTADDAGWSVGRGQQYAISFECEESY